jgi:ubiquitin-conjugating enzyme E2 G1
MTFPPNYPLYPPKMKFETPIFHPNGKSRPTGTCSTIRLSNKLAVYESGDVCISILHPPEEDQYGYEKASERWSPVLSPETVLLSVISMLGSPNDESAANIEAGKLWREDQKEFKRKVRRCVRDSMENAWG